MSSTSAVSVLAQGLRELRDFAEGPDGEELRERTGLTTQQIDAALGGEHLPPREVTMALVEAWEGDVEAWREYWEQIRELAEEDEAGDGGTKKAQTPAPPEPSIITPMLEAGAAVEGQAEPDQAEAEESGPVDADEPDEEPAGAGAVERETEDSEAEAVRARSAARAQLEANAQAAKAQSEAKAAEASARADDEEAAGEAQSAAGAEDGAGPEESRPAESGSADTQGVVEPDDAEPVTAEPNAETSVLDQVPEGSAQSKSAIAAGAPARAESVGLAGSKPGADARQTVKKSVLARIGIPVLLFAIGVGVGAFGDHALNSKQSSSNSAASVPPVSSSSSRPSHTAALSPSSSGASSSSSPTDTPSSAGANPTGTTSPTDGPTSASTSSTVAPGTVLGAYVGIQLASGYSVNFLTDPYHPGAGTANGPDTMGFFAGSFLDGRFYADRVAILDPTDTGSFTSCLNDTRYQHDVLLSQISTGSSFCITTGTGHLVLVTVRRLPSSTDANPYAVLDVTVWQGS